MSALELAYLHLTLKKLDERTSQLEKEKVDLKELVSAHSVRIADLEARLQQVSPDEPPRKRNKVCPHTQAKVDCIRTCRKDMERWLVELQKRRDLSAPAHPDGCWPSSTYKGTNPNAALVKDLWCAECETTPSIHFRVARLQAILKMPDDKLHLAFEIDESISPSLLDASHRCSCYVNDIKTTCWRDDHIVLETRAVNNGVRAKHQDRTGRSPCNCASSGRIPCLGDHIKYAAPCPSDPVVDCSPS